MTTALVYDPCFLGHDTGPAHPERPDRLRSIRAAISAAGLDKRCTVIAPRAAPGSTIARLHDPAYIERFRRAADSGARYLGSPEEAICEASFDLARQAVGSVLDAVDTVMEGRCRNALCAVRPPGHHAERDRAMGFCFFGNVAIAADHLIHRHGLERVLILDWDAHHGNGTQHFFEDRADVFYCSLHGHPRFLFPGSGWLGEVGTGPGTGHTLNVPLEPGAGDPEYRRAFDERVLPAIDRYRPQFVLVSAGFDAHRLDPLTPLCAECETFEWMTRCVLDVAAAHAGHRMVSVLEGGYHLQALAECVVAHLELLTPN